MNTAPRTAHRDRCPAATCASPAASNEIIGVLTNAELYHPATGTWSAAGSMNAAREVHTATLLDEGKVLVAGGVVPADTLASAELFSPAR